MQFLPLALVSGLLLLISAVLVTLDYRAYKRRREAAADEAAKTAVWKRFRFRVQASGGIGVVGVLILVGASIDARAHPVKFSLTWIIAILVTFWIALMALVDLMRSRQQLAELKHQEIIQTAIFKSELERARKEVNKHQETQANGKPAHGHKDKT